MARLVVNSQDFTEKLHKFVLRCKECNSNKVTLDIDWAAYPSSSWCNITVICENCHHDEEIYEAW